jgi:predicted nucleic acid-binding protein
VTTPSRRRSRVGGRPRATTASADTATDTLRYIESSALVAALLERDAAALASLRSRSRKITSAVTVAEAARAIVRARVALRLTPEEERAAVRSLRRFERRCHVVAVTGDILTRAGRPFPAEPIRTLDAVHLATVESLGEPPALVSIVTRDQRVRDNATAFGYAVE